MAGPHHLAVDLENAIRVRAMLGVPNFHRFSGGRLALSLIERPERTTLAEGNGGSVVVLFPTRSDIDSF